jgi:hypothetical protein
MLIRRFFAIGLCALLAACGQAPSGPAKADKPVEQPQDTSEPGITPASNVFVWPSTFRVMGDGFPGSGDPCRRLGETAATVDYLDDSAILVGCPGAATDAAAAAMVTAGGRVMGTAEGVTMISMPQGDANVGMTAAAKP